MSSLERPPDKSRDVFLFVNPTSGGNKAAAYTKLGKETIQFNLPDIGEATLHIYNIKDGGPGNKPGFLKLKQRLEEIRSNMKKKKPYAHVIVGGGDGTVMWAFTELFAHKIDTDDVAVGVVPFGTGNDFSRVMGWGGKPPGTLVGKDMNALKKMMHSWFFAKTVAFDLWNVEIETQPEGSFLFIDNKKKVLTDGHRKQHGITDLKEGGMRMTKPLCNYFSIGFSSRSGLGFDKLRTKSAYLNLIIYAWEGFKKFAFSPAPRMHKVMENIQSVGPDGETRTVVALEKTPAANAPKFVGDPVDLVFLNIPSYSKGCDIWARSHKIGLDMHDEQLKKELLAQKQCVGDSQLTVYTYNSSMAFMADVVAGQIKCHGCVRRARRVTQTGDETTINFKSAEDLGAKKGKVYMQIDGEFFVVKYPKSVTLKKFRKTHVLQNTLSSPDGCCVVPRNFTDDPPQADDDDMNNNAS